MRALRKMAAVFVAAGVLGACATVPAFAGTQVPTSFGFAQVNQGFYNYTDQTITLTGTLWDTETNTQIANEPVTVSEQVAGTGMAQNVASANTGADGNFTVTLTDQPVGGIFEAIFAGDTSNGHNYAASTSAPVQFTPEYYSDVDVAYTVNPKSPVATGSTVTFSGQVYVPADDNHGTNPKTPIAGANVYVFTGSGYTSTSPHAATSSSGMFSIPVKPAATSTYTVEVIANEPWPYCLYTYETIVGGTKITVINPRPTRIESFKVPVRHEIHRSFDASGTVQERSGRKWHAAPSATVALYYRSLPRGKWTYAGRVKTGSRGAFAWKSRIHKLGKFAWQTRVEQTAVGSTAYKASDSTAEDSFFVDRTYVTHFVARHLGRHTSLAAILRDYPQSGGAHYANVTGIAKFYYQPTGSSRWRYLGKARATRASAGKVAIEAAGRLDGKFKIIFPAQGDFLSSSGTRILR